MSHSQSRASTHSVPYSLDEAMSDFNHAPGTRPHHTRMFSDGEDRLSQDYDDMRASLSQGPHDRPWDWGPERPIRRPRDPQFDYDPRGPYQYDPPPPLPDRSVRGRSHDEYSPSPGPPPLHDRRHPMMPPPGPGPPGPYWSEPSYEPQRMRANSVGPPCPPHGPPHPPNTWGASSPLPPPPHATMPLHGGMPPPNMGGHPIHDNRFRPVPFRPNTPSDAPSPASMHSMSPAPSPRPTPPPTPPPPNQLNLMGPGGPPPQHPLPHPGPPPPHMHPPGPPRPMMGPPPPGPPMHMQRPPLPWEGPRDYPPPMGLPPRVPHTPMSHAPSPNMPGPPISMPGGRFPPMGPPHHPPLEWERNWAHR